MPMSRDLIIAILVSLFLHSGIALSGYLIDSAPAEVVVAEDEMPTIEILTPPPPQPEEPEIVDAVPGETAPSEAADLAPPMQTDTPSAVIDSPFVQRIQAPPPPGLNRATGAIVIPTGPPPTAVRASNLTNIFNLADLDENPRSVVRTPPVTPFEMRRAGIKGDVIMEFIIDQAGNVRDPVILQSNHPAFEQAAIDAVLKWKFKPGRKGGAAQNTRVRQRIEFKLNTD